MKNKTKALGIVACSMLFVASAISLAGCGGEKHTMQEKTAKAPTCTEAGYKAHFECSDCGKYFADAQGKTELKKEDVDLPATGHDVQKHAKADATCTADGYTQDFWYCANDCGTAWSNEGATEIIQNPESFVIPATEHEGTMTPVEYVAPGIDSTGILAHYHCSACNKDFEDAHGDREIENIVIPALQEKNLDVSVSIFDGDGKPVTDTSALIFTVKGVVDYSNVKAEGGKLSLKKAYEGVYTVETEGYQTAKLVVGENGTSELLFIPEFVSDDNPLDGNAVTLRLDKTADGVSRTVTVSSSESFAVDGTLLGDINWGDGSIIHGKFGRAKIALTSAQEAAAGLYFETTLKLTKNEVSSAGDRFAIQIGENLGGFVVVPRDGKQFMVSPIASDKKGEFTLNQFEPPVDISKECSNIATAGVRIRIKRLMNVYTFYIHDGTDWVEIQTQAIGSDAAKNEVLLAGAHGDWEFGDIKINAIQTQSFEYKAPTETEDGYKAHVKIIDGDDITYFMDGEIVEWADIEIPKLEVSATTVKLCLIDFNGNEAEIPAGFQLTLASDSVTYENVTVNSDGTLNLGAGKKLYSENYTVTAEGYLKTTISISKAATEKELDLLPEFVTSSNPNDYAESYLDLSIEKGTGKKTVTIHAHEGDWGQSLETKHSEVCWPLTQDDRDAKAIVIEMTIRFVSGDKSPADRVGVQMTGDKGGYVLSLDGRLDEIDKGHRAGLTLNWSPNNTGNYSETSIENGWKLRFERVGTAVVLRIWENGAWKVIMEGTCEENAKNDIRLMASHGVWEFADVKARTMALAKVEAEAPTTTAEGNLAHYTVTDGQDVYYFTPEMKATTLDDVTLPVLTEIAADITVNLIGTDGNKITNTSAIKFNLKSISYEYSDVTLTNGKLPSQLYEGEYTITADGFGKGKFVVEKDGDPVTLTLYQGFENSNPAGTGKLTIAYEKDAQQNVMQKVTLVGTDTSAEVIYSQRAEVQLLLTQDQKVADYMIVSGKLKFTGKNDNVARGGMTMTTDWNGFMLWHNSNRIDRHPGDYKLDQTDKVGTISYEELTAGIEFRLVRVNTMIALYIKGESGWELRASVSCLENVENDVRFAGGLGTWEYSDFEITLPAYQEYAAVAPSAGNPGNAAYYTLKIGNAAAEYYLSDGTPTDAEGVKIHTNVSVSMKDLLVSGDKTLTVDLDAETLDVGGIMTKRTILAYQRYGKDGNGNVAFYEKDQNNMIGNTGLFEATGRVSDDFCGNTNDLKFTSNGITNSSTGATDDAGGKFSVTLSLTKDVKQIVLFTGKWGGGTWAFTLAETNGGTVGNYPNAFSGSRGKMLVFDIDNSAWGSEETTHELVLTVEGCNVEYAALVLLGAETPATTKAVMSWNAVSTDNTVIDLDGTALDGRTILAYQRYGKEDATDQAQVAFYEKDQNNMIGNTGLYEATGRVINDFGGNIDCIKFTSNNLTNSSTGCTTDASQKLSVTLSLTKDVKQFVFYTGSWAGNVFEYTLTESDGTMIRSMRWQGGNPRAIQVVVDLDTSAWTDGQSHDVVFSLEGSCCMFGALVLLGAEA